MPNFCNCCPIWEPLNAPADRYQARMCRQQVACCRHIWQQFSSCPHVTGATQIPHCSQRLKGGKSSAALPTGSVPVVCDNASRKRILSFESRCVFLLAAYPYQHCALVLHGVVAWSQNLVSMHAIASTIESEIGVKGCIAPLDAMLEGMMAIGRCLL